MKKKKIWIRNRYRIFFQPHSQIITNNNSACYLKIPRSEESKFSLAFLFSQRERKKKCCLKSTHHSSGSPRKAPRHSFHLTFSQDRKEINRLLSGGLAAAVRLGRVARPRPHGGRRQAAREGRRMAERVPHLSPQPHLGGRRVDGGLPHLASYGAERNVGDVILMT